MNKEDDGLALSELRVKNKYYNTDFSVVTAEFFGLFCENYSSLYFARKVNDSTTLSEHKSEFFGNVLRTMVINLLAFKFEEVSFDEIAISGEINPTKIYSSLVKKTGLISDNEIDDYEWIFRSQNFFPDFFFYNFVYIIGEVASLRFLLRIMKHEIDFGDVVNMLAESGKNSVSALFNMIDLDLNDKSLYDVSSSLEAIWNCI